MDEKRVPYISEVNEQGMVVDDGGTNETLNDKLDVLEQDRDPEYDEQQEQAAIKDYEETVNRAISEAEAAKADLLSSAPDKQPDYDEIVPAEIVEVTAKIHLCDGSVVQKTLAVDADLPIEDAMLDVLHNGFSIRRGQNIDFYSPFEIKKIALPAAE